MIHNSIRFPMKSLLNVSNIKKLSFNTGIYITKFKANHFYASIRPISTSTTLFASRGKPREIPSKGENKEPKKKIPLLKELMRKVYLRIHPDLVHRYPKIADVNEENFQKLMEFFNTIRKGSPKKQRLTLTFYLRTSKDGMFEKADLNLVTTGGLCHHLVGKSLSRFFKGIGLPEKFEWGDDYWNFNKTTQDYQDWDEFEVKEIDRYHRRVAYNTGDFIDSQSLRVDHKDKRLQLVKDATKEIKKGAIAIGKSDLNEVSFRSTGLEQQYTFDDSWGKQFINNQSGDFEIRSLDKLAQAIAFVPFADNSWKKEVHYILNTVIPTLEYRGWPLRGAVDKIWAGGRHEESIYGWMDARSYQFMQRILHHSIRFNSDKNNGITFERYFVDDDDDDDDDGGIEIPDNSVTDGTVITEEVM